VREAVVRQRDQSQRRPAEREILEEDAPLSCALLTLEPPERMDDVRPSATSAPPPTSITPVTATASLGNGVPREPAKAADPMNCVACWTA